MNNRQIPRDASETVGQNHGGMSLLIVFSTTTCTFVVQMLCTADVTGESGARASLAIKDAVAPRAPLKMARLLMDMDEDRRGC